MDEKKLIQKALKDRESFSEIVSLYYKEIFKYIYRRTLDKELSKDLTQETFLRALKYLPSYKGKSLFIFWLLRIATNVINDHFRKEINENTFLKTTSNTYLNEQDSPEDQIDYEFIHKCMSKLSLREQAVITLIFFEHKNIKDAAFIIGKTANAMRRLYYRALIDLKKEIKKKCNNF